MAVAFRAVGTPTEAANGTTVSIPFTKVAGDTVLLAVAWAGNVTQQPTSVVWNGTNNIVGNLIGHAAFDPGTVRRMSLYIMPSDVGAAGAASFDVTWGSSVIVPAGVAYAYTVVDPAGAYSNAATNAPADSNSPSLGVTNTAGNLAQCAFITDETRTFTPTAGTQRGGSLLTSNWRFVLMDRADAGTPTTLSGTWSGVAAWLAVGAMLNAEASAAGNPWYYYAQQAAAGL